MRLQEFGLEDFATRMTSLGHSFLVLYGGIVGREGSTSTILCSMQGNLQGKQGTHQLSKDEPAEQWKLIRKQNININNWLVNMEMNDIHKHVGVVADDLTAKEMDAPKTNIE